jgi:hypothetical protein
VTWSRIFSAASNILTQLSNKRTAKQPTEDGGDRALVGGLVFPQSAELDCQVVFMRPDFNLKQLDAASPPESPSCRVGRASSPARRGFCVVWRSLAPHLRDLRYRSLPYWRHPKLNNSSRKRIRQSRRAPYDRCVALLVASSSV